MVKVSDIIIGKRIKRMKKTFKGKLCKWTADLRFSYSSQKPVKQLLQPTQETKINNQTDHSAIWRYFLQITLQE